MAAVDMTSIHFYQPPLAVSPRPSLKPPSLGNAGGKRTATIQCDRLDNLFKTNRRIEPTLQSKLAGDTRAGDGENSETAGNNWGGGDSDINNEEDLCFPSIESFGTPYNLSPEADKNTPLQLKKIDQALSDDEFLDIDAWTASLASDHFHLQGGAAQPSVKQSPSSRMSNPTLPTEDGPMAAMVTPEIWDSHKRNAYTIGLDEGSRVRMHEHSPEVLNNTGINNRIGKSVIKSTFESSDGQNKNPDIIPIRTSSKLLSKQVLAFSGLGGLNSKFETQDERSEDLIVIDDTDENSTDTGDHNPPPLKKHKGTKKATLRPVFKVPPGLGSYYDRALQDHENTASLNWASKVSGGSQDNLSLVLDKNTKTGDQSNSIETKYLKSEINIGDTQLNTSCSTEQSNSCYHLDSYAMTESLNPLCSPIITPSEDREGRTFHGCDYNGRTLAIVGSAGASTTIALAPERPQGQDGRAEVEEQEWEVIKILDKRETRSGTEYKVRWKSTWLPKSELGSARRLLWEYEAKSRAQHGPKRGRPSHKDKAW